MKTYLDCIPCFISQSLEAARMVTTNDQIHLKVLREVMSYLQTITFEVSPPETSREVHQIIRNLVKSKDPYKRVKNRANSLAKELFPHLKRMVENANDPLLMAVKLAIVGNVIDFGTMNRFNVEEMIDNVVNEDIEQESYRKFVEDIEKAETILYIGDNTGEIFFDKILLEELKNKQITYVVRANPIINDVTPEDAKLSGIDRIANVIAGDEGNDRSAPGIILKYASKRFLEHFNSADVVIAKGQGNYEALSDVDRQIFFLLMIKCPLVAKDIGVDVGRPVLKARK